MSKRNRSYRRPASPGSKSRKEQQMDFRQRHAEVVQQRQANIDEAARLRNVANQHDAQANALAGQLMLLEELIKDGEAPAEGAAAEEAPTAPVDAPAELPPPAKL